MRRGCKNVQNIGSFRKIDRDRQESFTQVRDKNVVKLKLRRYKNRVGPRKRPDDVVPAT